MGRFRFSIFLLIIFFLFSGCRNEREQQVHKEFSVSIRLAGDPEMLHPMLSRTAVATQIEGKIFQALQDYNPSTLLLEPVLIEDVPTVDTTNGFTVFTMKIREEAEWMDTMPVTGHDYLFTVKASLVPFIASVWGSVLNNIARIEHGGADNRNLKVYVESDYLLGEQIATNFMIYPEHLYDSSFVLRDFSLEELRDFEKLSEEKKETLKIFSEQFKRNTGNKGVIYGSGAYFLSSYRKDRQLVLERVNYWWGEGLGRENILFAANPKTLNYVIIPDEFTALNALRQGGIDVMAEVPPKDFEQLKNDPGSFSQLAFLNPAILQNYLMTINNDDPVLSDKKLRRAIAYGINSQLIIDNLFYGLAERSAGPVHPAKPFYNKAVKPVPFDKGKAVQLLEEEGWYLNDQGIRSKIVDGQLQILSFDLLTSDRQLGQDFAQAIEKQLLDIGIEVEITSLDVRELIKRARSKNYQLALLAIKQNPGWEDPFPYWHSQSDNPGGNNFFAYKSPEADSVIDLIRVTKSTDDLYPLYEEFQSIIFEDQPAVFLVHPQERLIVTKRLEVKPSLLRPGYFENTFKIRTL